MLMDLGFRDGPWKERLGVAVRAARHRPPGGAPEVHGAPRGHAVLFRRDILDRMTSGGFMGGLAMEDTAQMLEATNNQLAVAKATMETLVNELKAASDVIGPSLMKHVHEIRSARMTVITEVRDSLTAMRDLRRFFLESDYETEMIRLERFVRLCREIQALKADGVFDAVCDSALKLAVKP
jgi:uncharacterized damage-inducible protein DinB